MRRTFRQLIPLYFLIAIQIACQEVPLSDLKKEAQEVIEEAKVKAEKWGELSQEELQEIWAIEYQTTKVTASDLTELDEKLNQLGEERWDCYHVSDDREGKVFYFKRQKSSAVRYLTGLLKLGSLAF